VFFFVEFMPPPPPRRPPTFASIPSKPDTKNAAAARFAEVDGHNEEAAPSSKGGDQRCVKRNLGPYSALIALGGFVLTLQLREPQFGASRHDPKLRGRTIMIISGSGAADES